MNRCHWHWKFAGIGVTAIMLAGCGSGTDHTVAKTAAHGPSAAAATVANSVGPQRIGAEAWSVAGRAEAVLDGVVAVVDGPDSGDESTLTGVSASTGKTAWKFDVPVAKVYEVRTADTGFLVKWYNDSPNGVDTSAVGTFVGVVSPVSGKVLWKHQIAETEEPNVEYGGRAGMVVVENASDADLPGVVALDAKTGRTLWTKDAVSSADGYISNTIRPLGGSALMLAGGNIVHDGSRRDGSYNVKGLAISPTDGTTMWSMDLGQGLSGGYQQIGDNVFIDSFVDNSQVLDIDAKTGAVRAKIDGTIQSQDAQRIFVESNDQVVSAYDATGTAEWSLPADIGLGRLLYSDGTTAYVVTRGSSPSIAALDAKTGKQRNTAPLDDDADFEFVGAADGFVVANTDAGVAAFGA